MLLLLLLLLSRFSCVRLCATPWTVAHQAPLSMSAGVQLQQPGIQPEEMNSVGKEADSQFDFGLPVYFKFKILFYTFTKTLGQRFDIFSSSCPRFIISTNHCCSSNRVPVSVILSESALSSITYLL